MNRTMFWSTGAALVALCVASAPLAHAKARYWPAGQTITVIEPVATVQAGSRAYHVTDDPSYDLSGTHHTLFLVDDGTIYRSTTGRSVAFASAAGGTEVIASPATYRQDWMAVAAGDRPVRCLTPVRGVIPSEPAMMSGTSAEMTEAEYRKHRPARYSATNRRPYKKNHKKLSFTSYQPAATGYALTTNGAQYEYAVEAAVDEAIVGHEIYQLGNSFYMHEGDTWTRAGSWRGPYVEVNSVPREVRECAEARDDADAPASDE
jgi:hypothetical protein